MPFWSPNHLVLVVDECYLQLSQRGKDCRHDDESRKQDGTDLIHTSSIAHQELWPSTLLASEAPASPGGDIYKMCFSFLMREYTMYKTQFRSLHKSNLDNDPLYSRPSCF